ncbi:succinyl-diaminopimelate desuccinylase [Spiribacter vilamensis]|uniref:Succinyl-diaminopimelate desuccinylase n=2 Tax=Spiribacter vilamensis TaxID=531306 RepID=A0A4Q8CZI0_9GAMM|nr:succinyl-diaminopimelate desuccinylase [Spiribacter vilamensis]RZU98441.1 succinyldiaminopimelate desuccinylase [Spiribacter vilamensis]TVO62309.1 succinyl-diaminopimelate desuccinylase [Spiribacter vilamensis]
MDASDSADRALALTEALIARASVTPSDAGCQPLIAEHLTAAGFDIEWLPRGDVTNVLATRGRSGPLLLFVGHTDVVPAGPVAGWRSPPFEPTRRDGHLFGRGSADMKTSVAAFTTACEAMAATPAAVEGLRIAVALTSDEEGPAQDGMRAIAPILAERLGTIDWCLVGEPSSRTTLGDTIRVGRRGSLSGEISVTGRQGHVAYPDQADNPVHRLAPILAALVGTQWDSGTEEFPPTRLQITGIDTDTDAGNVIPGRASARFNLRYSPATTAEALQERITTTLETYAPMAGIHWHHSAVPFASDAGPLRQAISDVIEDRIGSAPIANTAGGTSDGRFIAPLGAEVVEFGPVNQSIHQIDENVAIDAIGQLTEAYEAIIRRLARIARRPD